MKKTFPFVALLLAGLFLLSSCAMTPGLSLKEAIDQASATVDPESPLPYWKEGTLKKIMAFTHCPKVKELTAHELADLRKYNLYVDLPSGMTSGLWKPHLIALNQNEGIEALLPVSEYPVTIVAVVYRVSAHDLPDALVSLYFTKEPAYFLAEEGEKMEEWWQAYKSHFFSITGPKKSSDFSSVQVGDSVEKLCSIDPSVCYDLLHDKLNEEKIDRMVEVSKEYYPDKTTEELREEFCTYSFEKLLADDYIMCVKYNEKTQLITEIEFSSTHNRLRLKGASFLAPLFS